MESSQTEPSGKELLIITTRMAILHLVEKELMSTDMYSSGTQQLTVKCCKASLSSSKRMALSITVSTIKLVNSVVKTFKSVWMASRQ